MGRGEGWGVMVRDVLGVNGMVRDKDKLYSVSDAAWVCTVVQW